MIFFHGGQICQQLHFCLNLNPSLGGGDDGFHCAVMLELLRVLSVSKKKLLHDVIFLFNGAEETVLQVKLEVEFLQDFLLLLVVLHVDLPLSINCTP